jgi:hypothetical protein
MPGHVRIFLAEVDPDGSLGAWHETLGMADSRAAVSAIVIGDFLYVLGGGQEPQATVLIGRLDSQTGAVLSWNSDPELLRRAATYPVRNRERQPALHTRFQPLGSDGRHRSGKRQPHQLALTTSSRQQTVDFTDICAYLLQRRGSVRGVRPRATSAAAPTRAPATRPAPRRWR